MKTDVQMHVRMGKGDLWKFSEKTVTSDTTCSEEMGFFFFFFLPHHHAACGILALRSGTEPAPYLATVEAWSLSHQGSPCLSIIDDDFI